MPALLHIVTETDVVRAAKGLLDAAEEAAVIDAICTDERARMLFEETRKKARSANVPPGGPESKRR